MIFPRYEGTDKKSMIFKFLNYTNPVKFTKNNVYSFSLGICFNSNDILFKSFRDIIQKLVESGIINTFEDKILNQEQEYQDMLTIFEDGNEVAPLSISMLQAGFVIWLVSVCTTVICFILEILYYGSCTAVKVSKKKIKTKISNRKRKVKNTNESCTVVNVSKKKIKTKIYNRKRKVKIINGSCTAVNLSKKKIKTEISNRKRKVKIIKVNMAKQKHQNHKKVIKVFKKTQKLFKKTNFTDQEIRNVVINQNQSLSIYSI